MKKTILSSLAMLAVAAIFTTGCRPTPVTPATQPILGKWTMAAAISHLVVVNGGDTKDTIRYTNADYFTFKADSTVDIMAGGQAHNGRWKMVNNVVTFTGTNYMDAPTTGWQVSTLTANKLEFYHYESTTYTTSELKLDLVK